MKDMGKVMGLASKELSGKSDGKTISEIVRKIVLNWPSSSTDRTQISALTVEG